MDESLDCPFCDVPSDQLVGENDHAVAFRDRFPVTEGHTLVVRRIRTELESDLSPDGFNIGINDGQAAGQTIGHAHVHVIPRRAGDVLDPWGGVRWVIPDRAIYWSEEE